MYRQCQCVPHTHTSIRVTQPLSQRPLSELVAAATARHPIGKPQASSAAAQVKATITTTATGPQQAKAAKAQQPPLPPVKVVARVTAKGNAIPTNQALDGVTLRTTAHKLRNVRRKTGRGKIVGKIKVQSARGTKCQQMLVNPSSQNTHRACLCTGVQAHSWSTNNATVPEAGCSISC